MKNKLKHKHLNKMREDALKVLRRLFPFYPAMGENFSRLIHVMLFGVWGNQRLGLALPEEQINGAINK